MILYSISIIHYFKIPAIFNIKKTFIFLILITVELSAGAQKLPKVQSISRRTPKTIKIDGIATEWGNHFQAYNTATEVYYSLANDDTNLYFVLQATDPLVIRKIIAASITFTINLTRKEIDKGHNISLIYPVFDRKEWPAINLRDKPIVSKDSVINHKQIDSFMNAINTQLINKAKNIKVLGIAAVGDTLLSIYNEYGIKAAALFDHQINYTYELAVPLKYLGLSIANPVKFNYNVQVNGSNIVEGVSLTVDAKGNTIMHVMSKNPPRGVEFQYMRYPTDFWGEYTLAK